jgi:hypothetical protein
MTTEELEPTRRARQVLEIYRADEAENPSKPGHMRIDARDLTISERTALNRVIAQVPAMALSGTGPTKVSDAIDIVAMLGDALTDQMRRRTAVEAELTLLREDVKAVRRVFGLDA